jgi:hypothetical protein
VAQVFRDHAVIKDPLHPFVLKKMSSWLERCDARHPKCYHAKDLVPLPTRLLDLSSFPTRQEMLRHQGDPRELFTGKACKLVETSKGFGRYGALSYCWGKTLAYKTTKSNLQEHSIKGISYAEVPKTLQDALFLVRYLGLQYVWIDCVCIVQNDSVDWEREAAQMGTIYSKAYLTIAATRASHCGEGFLQPRHEKNERQKMSYADKAGAVELHFAYNDLTTAPGAMASVTPQPLRFQRVRSNINTEYPDELTRVRVNHSWDAYGVSKNAFSHLAHCTLLAIRCTGNVRRGSRKRVVMW